MHYGSEKPRIQTLSTGTLTGPFAHSLASFIHPLTPHCSLHLLRCTHSFTCSLAHSLPSSGKRSILSMKWMRWFHTVSTHCWQVLSTGGKWTYSASKFPIYARDSKAKATNSISLSLSAMDIFVRCSEPCVSFFDSYPQWYRQKSSSKRGLWPRVLVLRWAHH